MPTAKELLKSISVQPDPEGHIVVGGDRFIIVPENLKRLGVQFDHNMETVTFDCPRYWDNRDMSKMAVYVNYQLSNGYRDRYPADNVREDGDVMHFDWTISKNVTQVAGSVAFLICVMKTDADGNEERHWNSELCQDCYISEGMETEEHPALQYPDEVTQLLLRMSTVEQINVQAEEMQALYDATVEVANTAEEVKNQALDGSGYIRNSYANAIKGNVSGEIIRVDDVSPIEHDVKCGVHGKNLFNINALEVMPADYSVRISNIDTTSNSITITTASTHTGNGYCGLTNAAGNYVPTLRDFCPQLKAGKTYVLSGNSESTTRTLYLRGVSYPWIFGKSLLITEDHLNSKIALYGLNSAGGEGTGDCVISNIQIEEGTASTEYEPYINPETVTVSRIGKNLFDISAIKSQGSVTNNGDGSLSVTASTSQPVEKLSEICPGLKAGDVATLSFVSANKNQNFIYLVGSKESWHNGTSKTITQEALDGVIYFYANKDASGNAIATYITNVQIELGEKATGYTPYVTPVSGVSITNGSVALPSVSPTVTLFTDTPGVIIEAEYNVDTEKFLSANLTDDRIQSAVDNWLAANYTSAEGVKF